MLFYFYNIKAWRTQTRVYRLSINGKSTWRPVVRDIRVYSDFKCTRQIAARYVDQSGSNPKGSNEYDGSKAFDDSTATTWRPQCGPCDIGEAWVIFSTEFDIKCAEAPKLGKGEMNNGKHWNVGIKVERLYLGTWISTIESNTGNIANGSYPIRIDHPYIYAISSVGFQSKRT